ncbi:MAG TPA: hypothetical protein VFU02_02170 [Polyangiaceae bacterium]|nr:hypothetical protein [Polyangiaceae bacterium]
MMAASNRATGSKRPCVVGSRARRDGVRACPSSSRFDLGIGEAWQDALDPELPAEPTLGVRHTDSSLLGSRPGAHKLILMGLVIGASLQALGYFGAAYLF